MVRTGATLGALALFLCSTVSAAVPTTGHHHHLHRVRRGPHHAVHAAAKPYLLEKRDQFAACQGENLQRRDLTSYISDQVGRLQKKVSSQGGGSQQTSTVVEENGVPTTVKVEASEGTDSQGKGSKYWSWSWSTPSTSSSAGSQASKDEHNSAKAISVAGQKCSSKGQDAAGAGKSAAGQSTERHEASSYNFTGSMHHEASEHKESFSDWHSSSSFSYAELVSEYVVTSNVQKSANIGPFVQAEVEWTGGSRGPKQDGRDSGRIGGGEAIPRPADADVCNRRFPFTTQPFTANDRDARFSETCHEEGLDELSKLALSLHNEERARYGLPQLQWNVELANMAACWADLKAYGHSEDHFCASGENIAMGSGPPCYSSPESGMRNAIYSFLDEDRNWAANPTFGEDNGHWTQIVWKDTRWVGCAISQRKDLGDVGDTYQYVVCEYFPPGNVQGQFDSQVPSPRPLPQLRSQCSANERHGS